MWNNVKIDLPGPNHSEKLHVAVLWFYAVSTRTTGCKRGFEAMFDVFGEHEYMPVSQIVISARMYYALNNVLRMHLIF